MNGSDALHLGVIKLGITFLPVLQCIEKCVSWCQPYKIRFITLLFQRDRQRRTLITVRIRFRRKRALGVKLKEYGLDNMIMFFVESSEQIRLELTQ